MSMRTTRRLAVLAALTVTAASAAGAQAWSYPSFQVPHVTGREFNFLLADGDNGAGTSFVGQWREGLSTGRDQFSLDVGFADPDGPSNTGFLIGGQFAHQLATASAQMPLDLLLTVSANLASGDNVKLFRIPIGVSLGHRFPLEGGMAITPYAHPRISWDHVSVDGGGSSSDMGLNMEVGAGFDFTPQLGLRFGATFGDNDTFDYSSFGLSLAWHPAGAR